MNNSFIKNISLCGVLFVIAFLSLYAFGVSISPSTPYEGVDSCVYKQMGLTILQGKTPYIDIFDHKGPILYLINALGLWISSGRWGLFLINVLNLTGTLFLWNKIARNYTSEKTSLIVIFMTLVLYICVMNEGNLTEDWSLLPLSYSLFIASRYLSRGIRPALLESLFIGFSAGIIVFIRANNAALLISSCFLIFYLLIKDRTIKYLMYTIFGMLIGFFMLSTSVILIIYSLYGTTGVEEMIYGTFIFNMKYTSWNSYYEFFISSFYNHFFFFLSTLLCILSSLNHKKEKQRNIYSLFFILTFVFCYLTMGRYAFRHYLITVIPLFAMCSAYAFGNELKPYIICIVFSLLYFESFLKGQLQYTHGQVKRDYIQLYSEMDSTIASAELKNGIWNYNSGFDGLGYLMHHNATQRNRVILTFQLNISPDLYNKKLYSIKKDLPRYILIDPNKPFINKQDSLFIITNYTLKKQFEMNSVSKNSNVNINIDLYEHTSMNNEKNGI